MVSSLLNAQEQVPLSAPAIMELQALAENIFATPAAVVEQAKQALEYRAP